MKRLLVTAFALSAVSTASADAYEEHDYTLNCSGCHRMDGSGSSVVPSFRDMRELAGKPGAREYWIRVPGAAQAPLTDERLAAMMNWLIERFTGKAPEPAYTASEVHRLRSKPLRDPAAERRRIMTQRETDTGTGTDTGTDADTGAGAGTGTGTNTDAGAGAAGK